MTLSPAEARQLLEALAAWNEDVSLGIRDPGWHTHVSDAEGNELTIAVEAGTNGQDGYLLRRKQA